VARLEQIQRSRGRKKDEGDWFYHPAVRSCPPICGFSWSAPIAENLLRCPEDAAAAMDSAGGSRRPSVPHGRTKRRRRARGGANDKWARPTCQRAPAEVDGPRGGLIGRVGRRRNQAQAHASPIHLFLFFIFVFFLFQIHISIQFQFKFTDLVAGLFSGSIFNLNIPI
jgi:hypothetical protein